MKHSVSIKNKGELGVGFDPQELTVAPGDTVCWTNHDKVNHIVIDDESAERLQMVCPGPPPTSCERTYPTAGTFPYHCAKHPQMKGTIVVEAAKHPVLQAHEAKRSHHKK